MNNLNSYLENAKISSALRKEFQSTDIDVETLLEYKLACKYLPPSNIGVYAIVNVETNKRYIGQSRNLTSRIRQHKYKLNNNTHPNKELQHDWDNLTPDHFEFIVLEYCSLDLLDDIEIKWHLSCKDIPLYSNVYKHYQVPLELWEQLDKMLEDCKNCK